ncbi:hypothetical protein KD050_18835 [Psychrobacillus sp. INOP01]|uniref:hypothetical protein n=1 Tax=Psychrobacillus sp. INOP01 TaxID=2829187 RepID=UPI001BAC5387|nr:hypothetical protein [Psychrobacillus sp. INOP01]QUG41306.1 hypothetical protein KD050_18835 [Psychrobacillus sp. INOP01]
MSNIHAILDNFLEAELYANELSENGASKEAHEKADEILRKQETALLSAIGLNLEIPSDSDKFDRILELVEEYRNDESRYETMVSYVESLSR